MSQGDDLRTFVREFLTRFERVVQGVERELAAQRAEASERHGQLMQEHRELLGEMREFRRKQRQEYLAHRKALFHLLDRLPGDGGAETA